MTFTAKTKNWLNLIAVLKSEKENFQLANIQLKNGIDTFCLRLQSENIIHASKNSSGSIWKAKSLITCFCETFDPILIGLFPEDSFTYTNLVFNEISLPLANHLVKKESCKEFADKIKMTVNAIENFMPIGNQADWPKPSAEYSEWNNLIKDGENLELLVSLLDAIYEELNLNDEIKWCTICFRVANKMGNYCDLHATQNDTNYRKGLRVKDSIPVAQYTKFLSQRSKRKMLKDDFLLASSPFDISNQIISHKSKAIYVDSLTKELVSNTDSLAWQTVAKDWDYVLQAVPLVNMRLNNKASYYGNWDEFIAAILVAIDNPYEKTKHPYWIFLMLAEAEIWFSIEDSFANFNPTSKKDEIEKLLSQGLRNFEIVNQLNVSNSYVSELKKRKPKNIKRNKLPIFGGAAKHKTP